jgi:hypothetical protein
MDGKKRRDEKWAELEEMIANEVMKARQRAMLADSFDEMEEIVVEVGERVQQAMLSAMAEQRQPSGAVKCPKCGGQMSSKGLKKRQLKSSVGKVRFERERWTCPACKTSLFPPGSKTEA